MKSTFIGLFLFLFSLSTFAQGPVYKSSADSVMEDSVRPLWQKINIHEDPRVDSLLTWHIAANKREGGTDGYRVEIFFSSGLGARKQSLDVKTDFLKEFPETGAYMTFQSPDFKVCVGDCRTKNEALKLRERIKKSYPNAFIVPDIIHFPKLYREKEQP